MHEIVGVPLADLLFDPENARLEKPQPSQQATALALARAHGKSVLKLAEDILKMGMDPSALPIVVPTGGQRKQYKVLEGNRRLLALKALENPSLIATELGEVESRKLAALARQFANRPISRVDCVLFDTADEALPWIDRRHTGYNDGVGLSEWDANQIDLFRSRHGGPTRPRNVGGQVLDFVNRIDGDSGQSNKGLITNLQRLANSPEVRRKFGLDRVSGALVSRLPVEEAIKPWRRIVADLRSGTLKVGEIYSHDDRVAYLNRMDAADLPDLSKAAGDSVTLDDLKAGTRKPAKAAPAKAAPAKTTARAKAAAKKHRATMVPADCKANVTPPRINAIYNEIRTLNVEQYPNACAVLLRVFVELSVDHEIQQAQLMTDAEMGNANLAKRLKKVAAHLEASGKIPLQLRRAIDRIADSQLTIAASTFAMNQYVHNEYAYPKPQDLQIAWDELQPFVEKLWP